jgi:hypothetical protein
MGLLEQYKQQRPEAFQERGPAPVADPYGREYSSFVRLVTRLSGGKIRTTQQANYVLVAAAILFLLVSFFLFFRNSRPAAPTSAETLRDTPVNGLRQGAEKP